MYAAVYPTASLLPRRSVYMNMATGIEWAFFSQHIDKDNCFITCRCQFASLGILTTPSRTTTVLARTSCGRLILFITAVLSALDKNHPRRSWCQ
jgi:hypothetical protein